LLELRVMLTPTAIEGLACARHALPQFVLGRPVETIDTLPLVDQRSELLDASLEGCRVRELLGLLDQLLTLSHSGFAGLRLLLEQSRLLDVDENLKLTHAGDQGCQVA